MSLSFDHHLLFLNYNFVLMGKISKHKIVMMGDQNVGKTSIISRYINDGFDSNYKVHLN